MYQGRGESPHQSRESPSYTEERPKWKELLGLHCLHLPKLGGDQAHLYLRRLWVSFSAPAWESSFPSSKALFITLWFHDDVINKPDLKWQKSTLENTPGLKVYLLFQIKQCYFFLRWEIFTHCDFPANCGVPTKWWDLRSAVPYLDKTRHQWWLRDTDCCIDSLHSWQHLAEIHHVGRGVECVIEGLYGTNTH